MTKPALLTTHHEDEIFATHSLDHRMRPETRAMLAAMSSRMPQGGISARYREIIEDATFERMLDEDLALHESGVASLEEAYDSDYVVAHDDAGDITLREHMTHTFPGHCQKTEELLQTEIPPKVQEFMDRFVGNYGHSSIMELTGSPTVFVEGVSWYTAWLSFDGPLVKGQEFSTRAKAYKDWPICYEASDDDALIELHDLWLKMFAAEVSWWKDHLTNPKNREALGIADKEPFRPAYDRARWALPGTIATGFAHAANVRDMGRVIRNAKALAYNTWRAAAGNSKRPYAVWEAIEKTYDETLPALSGYSLRTALTAPDDQSENWHRVPGHFLYWEEEPNLRVILRELRKLGAMTYCGLTHEADGNFQAYVRGDSGGYIDPSYNRTRAQFTTVSSLAVARDWHRHRTMMPWTMHPLLAPLNGGTPVLHHDYEPKSAYAQERLTGLMTTAGETYRDLLERQEHYLAILALPLGASCLMEGYGGLRDMVYMLELRSKAHGTNFEYREQAKSALAQLANDVDLESL